MKNQRYFLIPIFLFTALLSGWSVCAQTTVYEQFDVDSAAAPRGGLSTLETFMTANLRKPFTAQVANATGRVFVKAVVEPTGYVSAVTLVRGFRPDCDQEALRVMRLFNAWKPAMKSGQAVRQAVTYPVLFRTNEPVRYVAGQRVEYFDKNQKLTNDAQAAIYQQSVPIDSVTGLPTGDLVVLKGRGTKLSEVLRVPLVRVDNAAARAGEPMTYSLGHLHKSGRWYGPVYVLDAANKLRSVKQSATNEQIDYTEAGMVCLATNANGTASRVSWHGNGQVRQVESLDESAEKSMDGLPTYRLVSAWDSTGRLAVVAGNGQWSHHSRVASRSMPEVLVQFTETGTYANGLKDGVWTGTYSDGSYRYEETFTGGKPQGGKAVVNGTPIAYTAQQQLPTFKGGQAAMYRFMGQTIRYPIEAMRAQVQGKVFVSFTVCTDGSLCDYTVVEGVDPSLDEEALRVVRKMSGQWQPGYQRGEPVRVNYNMPVSFQME